jgi:hypothetical protein
VCNADTRDDRRVAKDGRRAGEVVEESNSGAKKNRRDVAVDFVEETSIQALPDGVSGVDPAVRDWALRGASRKRASCLRRRA